MEDTPDDKEVRATPDADSGIADAAPTPSLEEVVDVLFDDPDAKRNIVGLFDLLFKIDRRLNPHLYENHD